MNIPLELLPPILLELSHPSLAAACLVSRTFYAFAVRVLYERVFLRDRRKTLGLLATLSERPDVAAHAREIDIVLPRHLFTFAKERNAVLSSLGNCANLTTLALTRHGNLTNELIDCLCTNCPHLQHLAINGDSRRMYDPSALLRFTSLSGIKLVKPGAEVLEILGDWLHNLAGSLTSLDIIEPINDALNEASLSSLAPSLTNLRHLSVSGCALRSFTAMGLWAILVANKEGIRSLHIQDLTSSFDLGELSSLFASRPAVLSHLVDLTLPTLHEDLPQVLSTVSIRRLQISRNSSPRLLSPDVFWAPIIADHAQTLVCLCTLVSINDDVLEMICRNCIVLEELYAVIPRWSDTSLQCLSLACRLRNIYLNSLCHPGPIDMFEIIDRCPRTLRQFGLNTNVWEVERRPRVICGEGDMQVFARFFPCSSPDAPEAILVSYAR